MDIDDLYVDVFRAPLASPCHRQASQDASPLKGKTKPHPWQAMIEKRIGSMSPQVDDCSVDIYADLSRDTIIQDSSSPAHEKINPDKVDSISKGGDEGQVKLDLFTEVLTLELTDRDKLQQRLKALEATNQTLMRENKELKQCKEQLGKNISSLYVTARKEISRMEEEISQLRKTCSQLENRRMTRTENAADVNCEDMEVDKFYDGMRDRKLNLERTPEKEVKRRNKRKNIAERDNHRIEKSLYVDKSSSSRDRHDEHSSYPARPHSTGQHGAEEDRTRGDKTNGDLRYKLKRKMQEGEASYSKYSQPDAVHPAKVVVNNHESRGEKRKMRTVSTSMTPVKDTKSAVKASPSPKGKAGVGRGVERKHQNQVRDRLQEEINQSYSLAACQGVASRGKPKHTSAGSQEASIKNKLSQFKNNCSPFKVNLSKGSEDTGRIASSESHKYKGSGDCETDSGSHRETQAGIARSPYHDLIPSEQSLSSNTYLSQMSSVQEDSHVGKVECANIAVVRKKTPCVNGQEPVKERPTQTSLAIQKKQDDHFMDREVIVHGASMSEHTTDSCSDNTAEGKYREIMRATFSDNVHKPVAQLCVSQGKRVDSLTNKSSHTSQSVPFPDACTKSTKNHPETDHDSQWRERLDDRKTWVSSTLYRESQSAAKTETLSHAGNEEDQVGASHRSQEIGSPCSSVHSSPASLELSSSFVDIEGVTQDTQVMQDNEYSSRETGSSGGASPDRQETLRYENGAKASSSEGFLAALDSPVESTSNESVPEAEPGLHDDKSTTRETHCMETDDASSRDRNSNCSNEELPPSEAASGGSEDHVRCEMSTSPAPGSALNMTHITCTTNLILLGEEEGSCTAFTSPYKSQQLVNSELYPPGVRAQVQEESSHVRHIRGLSKVIKKVASPMVKGIPDEEMSTSQGNSVEHMFYKGLEGDGGAHSITGHPSQGEKTDDDKQVLEAVPFTPQMSHSEVCSEGGFLSQSLNGNVRTVDADVLIAAPEKDKSSPLCSTQKSCGTQDKPASSVTDWVSVVKNMFENIFRTELETYKKVKASYGSSTSNLQDRQKKVQLARSIRKSILLRQRNNESANRVFDNVNHEESRSLQHADTEEDIHQKQEASVEADTDKHQLPVHVTPPVVAEVDSHAHEKHEQRRKKEICNKYVDKKERKKYYRPASRNNEKEEKEMSTICVDEKDGRKDTKSNDVGEKERKKESSASVEYVQVQTPRCSTPLADRKKRVLMQEWRVSPDSCVVTSSDLFSDAAHLFPPSPTHESRTGLGQVGLVQSIHEADSTSDGHMNIGRETANQSTQSLHDSSSSDHVTNIQTQRVTPGEFVHDEISLMEASLSEFDQDMPVRSTKNVASRGHSENSSVMSFKSLFSKCHSGGDSVASPEKWQPKENSTAHKQKDVSHKVHHHVDEQSARHVATDSQQTVKSDVSAANIKRLDQPAGDETGCSEHGEEEATLCRHLSLHQLHEAGLVKAMFVCGNNKSDSKHSHQGKEGTVKKSESRERKKIESRNVSGSSAHHTDSEATERKRETSAQTSRRDRGQSCKSRQESKQTIKTGEPGCPVRESASESVSQVQVPVKQSQSEPAVGDPGLEGDSDTRRNMPSSSPHTQEGQAGTISNENSYVIDKHSLPMLANGSSAVDDQNSRNLARSTCTDQKISLPANSTCAIEEKCPPQSAQSRMKQSIVTAASITLPRKGVSSDVSDKSVKGDIEDGEILEDDEFSGKSDTIPANQALDNHCAVTSGDRVRKFPNSGDSSNMDHKSHKDKRLSSPAHLSKTAVEKHNRWRILDSPEVSIAEPVHSLSQRISCERGDEAKERGSSEGRRVEAYVQKRSRSPSAEEWRTCSRTKQQKTDKYEHSWHAKLDENGHSEGDKDSSKFKGRDLRDKLISGHREEKSWKSSGRLERGYGKEREHSGSREREKPLSQSALKPGRSDRHFDRQREEQNRPSSRGGEKNEVRDSRREGQIRPSSRGSEKYEARDRRREEQSRPSSKGSEKYEARDRQREEQSRPSSRGSEKYEVRDRRREEQIRPSSRGGEMYEMRDRLGAKHSKSRLL